MNSMSVNTVTNFPLSLKKVRAGTYEFPILIDDLCLFLSPYLRKTLEKSSVHGINRLAFDVLKFNPELIQPVELELKRKPEIRQATNYLVRIINLEIEADNLFLLLTKRIEYRIAFSLISKENQIYLGENFSQSKPSATGKNPTKRKRFREKKEKFLEWWRKSYPGFRNALAKKMYRTLLNERCLNAEVFNDSSLVGIFARNIFFGSRYCSSLLEDNLLPSSYMRTREKLFQVVFQEVGNFRKKMLKYSFPEISDLIPNGIYHNIFNINTRKHEDCNNKVS